MRNANPARGLRLATPLLFALVAACGDAPADEAAAAPAVIAAPLWVNGDFETDAIGKTPPSGWTLTTYLNGTASTRGAVSGSPSTPPSTFAQLNLGTPGAGQIETYTIGGVTNGEVDPNLGSDQPFRFPMYGARSIRLNYRSAGTYDGHNKNANAITQQMTVAPGDIDPTDGRLHIRFAIAPVLENPGHAWNEQPYYYFELLNVTRGTSLYREFNVSGTPGVPWRTAAVGTTPVLWLDWKLVDIAPVAGSFDIGDQVKLVAVASGCGLGGHFGRIYVDGLGPQVPGPYVWATADKPSVSANATLTYTFNYANGGAAATIGSHIDFTTPPGTTFASIVSPTGITCATPAASASGVVSCPLGMLAAGARGAFSVTVNVTGSAVSPITNGNYLIGGVNSPNLLGATVTTTVIGAPSASSIADVSVAMAITAPTSSGPSVGHQAVVWGATNTQYWLRVTNTSANTHNVQTKWSIPTAPNGTPLLTNVTWCRLKNSDGTQCSTSSGSTGTGNLLHTQSLTGNQTRYYRITGTVAAATATNCVAGSGCLGAGAKSGQLNHTVTVASTTLTDLVPSNNTTSIGETIGSSVRTLTVNKVGGAAAGTITSSPAGINIDAAATSGNFKFGLEWTVRLSATPSFGYVFTSWGGDGSACGTASTCNIAMSAVAAPVVSATFSAAPTPTAAAIYVFSGDDQRARTSSAYAAPLAALVTDTSGNPVPNASVTFTAVPVAGASATLAPLTAVTTNVYGIAKLTGQTANATAGKYTVTASTAGVALPATFKLNNVGAPYSISYVQGGKDAWSANPSPLADINAAPVGAQFNAPLMVIVKDVVGNPVPNVGVTFTVPGSGASGVLSSASATTDASGLASVTVTSSATAGQWSASANTTTTPLATAASFLLTNLVASPAAIYVVSGTPQRTNASGTFSSSLVAVVVDAGGNPVPNASVTFTAPDAVATTSLASAQLAGQGYAATTTSNALGLASVSGIANDNIGNYVVSAKVSGVSGSADFALTNLGANTLSIIDGDDQVAAIGAAFAKGLRVQLSDSSDAGVSGATITFTAVPTMTANGSAGATLSPVTATTDASGFATSAIPTAGLIAGSYTVIASASTASTAPVVFDLKNVPGAARNVTLIDGDNQSAQAPAGFGKPLSVKVTDAGGNTVEGATVTFTAPSSGATATLDSSEGITGTDGTTSITAAAGEVTGSYTVSATVPSGLTSATFNLQNASAAPAHITLVSGDNQSAIVGAAFAAPLVVRVTDGSGNPVAGRTVSFAGTSATTASVAIAAGLTDADGRSQLSVTAGTLAASYQLVATTSGVGESATFHLGNTAGAPAKLAIVSGDGQHATVRASYAESLVFGATDLYDNPVVGAAIEIDTSACVSSEPLGTSVTNAAGQLSFSLVAGVAVGSCSLSARLFSGSIETASVAPKLWVDAATPTHIAVFAGDNQGAFIDAPFTTPLVVRVTDSDGNPVPAITVVYSGASATTAVFTTTPAPTDGDGFTWLNASAGTFAGSYEIVAAFMNGQVSSADSNETAVFHLSNGAGPAAHIEAVSGGGQAAVVATPFLSDLVVKVSDRYGNPVKKAAVAFTGTSATTATAVTLPARTDVFGLTRMALVAGTQAGSYAIDANTDGAPETARFLLGNTFGDAAHIVAVSGDAQSAVVDAAFAAPLVVRVSDGFGNPVPGIAVSFADASATTALFDASPEATDANGITHVDVTAGTLVGSYEVQASCDDSNETAVFHLSNRAGGAAHIVAFSGDAQSAVVDAAFAAPLTVKVSDSHGNAIADAIVDFSGASHGNVVFGATPALTDAAGKTSLAVTAGIVATDYEVRATTEDSNETAVFHLSNTFGAAAHIVAIAGDEQSAIVDASFTAPLTVKVTDRHDNAVAGATVDFAGDSSDHVVFGAAPVATNTSGITSLDVTAGTLATPYEVHATTDDANETAVFHLTNTFGRAAHIVAVAGDNQSATVDASFALALTVKVSDRHDNAVVGATVDFSGDSSSHIVFGATPAKTDAAGKTSLATTAGTQATTYEVSATTDDANETAVFHLTNTFGRAAHIVAVAGDNQSSIVATSFARPLTVKVTDRHDNPVAHASVDFSGDSAANVVFGATPAKTDAAGETSLAISAGTLATLYDVSAVTEDANETAVFHLSNTFGAAAHIVAIAGDDQSSTVDTSFAAPLVVRVTDAFANPVPQVDVTFADASATTVLFDAAPEATDDNGTTHIDVTAGTLVGAYELAASFEDGNETAVFHLSNRAGGAAHIVAVAGDNQSAVVDATFAAPLIVKLTDAHGNAVADATVVFTGASSGNVVFGAKPALTDAAGKTSLEVTAGTLATTYEVSATTDDANETAVFHLTNTFGAAAHLTATAGNDQSAVVDASFATPLTVKVTDRHDNPVAHATVTFSGDSATNVVFGATPAATNKSGITSLEVTAGTLATRYEVSATTDDANETAVFRLANTFGTAAHIVAIAGDNQSAVVDASFAAPLTVKVTDRHDNPVANAIVDFSGDSSTNVVFGATPAATNASGITSLEVTAGTLVTTYEVNATTDDANETATFHLGNTFGQAAHIVAVSGDHQSAVVDASFAAPLVVRVTDLFGNPVSNVAVTFADPSATTALFDASPEPTDDNGTTHIDVTAGTLVGAYELAASYADSNETAVFNLSNTFGKAAHLSAVSGDNQSAVIDASFVAPLTVKVTDRHDNAVANATVTFSGASASNVVFGATPAATDKAGVTSLDVTAGTLATRYEVSAVTDDTNETAIFQLTNTFGPAAHLTAVSGDNQSAVVDAAFAAPLVVKVSDRHGNPVAGTTVDFSGDSSANAVFGATPAATDKAGITSLSLTAGTLANSYEVKASVVAISDVATFTLTNTFGAAAQLAIVSGDAQSAVVDAAFAAPLVVKVSDRHGNPVAGSTVAFSGANTADVVFRNSPEATDITGETALDVSAGTRVGSYQVGASSAGTTPVAFHLSNTFGPAAHIVAISGNNQSAIVATAFAAPLGVRVTDRHDNPVPAAEVVFGAASDASVTFGAAPALTDAAGETHLDITAGTSVRDYQVSAKTQNASAAATFYLANTVGAPARLDIVSGDHQAVVIDQRFPSPLVVRLSDAFGNPVSGVAVSFTLPGGATAGTLPATPLTTDHDGRVTITPTAGTVAGSYGISATAVGATPVTFSFVNLAGVPATLERVSGNDQTTTVTAVFDAAFVVRVRDLRGNPLAQVPVTFAAPTSGASAELSHVATTTDNDGLASFTATANPIAGAFVVSATALTLPPVDFALTNSAGEVTHLDVPPAASTQATRVTTAFSNALEVVARDAHDNPVPDVALVFAAPTSDVTAALGATTLTTDEDGAAWTAATASAHIGSYHVTVQVAAAPAIHATFTLSNLPGAASTIVAVSGTPASTEVESTFVAPLVVRVSDAEGNPVPAARVVFTTATSGASATLDATVAVTDAAGQAHVAARANDIAGSHVVSATVATAAVPALFDLTNVAGAPSVSHVTPIASEQSTLVMTGFANELELFVEDERGNPVPAATVTWRVPASGASATLAAEVTTTDSLGHTHNSIVANALAGSYQVFAEVSGIAQPAVFDLANLPSVPRTLRLIGAGIQGTQVDTAFAEPLAVMLCDAFGNPISGAPITFSGPTSAAHATFDATATSDADGYAHVFASASRVSGHYEVRASSEGATSSVVFSLTNLAGPVTRLVTAANASPQAAQVGTAFANPLAVSASDAFDNPVPAVIVTWRAAETGPTAHLSVTQAVTDANGEAAINAIAGARSGQHEVVASVGSIVAVFSLDNLIKAGHDLALFSGGGQSTIALTPFAAPVVVLVTDSEGHPAANVAVALDVAASGLTVANSTAVSDAQGHAHFELSAGRRVGGVSVVATAEGATAPVVIGLEVMTIPTVTTLWVGPPGADTVRLVAIVTADFGRPAQGLVRFFDGKSEIGAVTLEGESASLEITLGVAPHDLSARFEGDGPYAASTSATISVDRPDYTYMAEGGGCTSGGSGSLVGGLVALALLLVLRRRTTLV